MNTKTVSQSDLTFVPYNDEIGHLFKAINLEWISDMFEVEPSDLSSLDHPQLEILDRGGKIWFARHSELGVVGTCALIRKDGSNFELTKMGVLAKARGLKIGEPLLQHVLADAESMDMDLLYLLTNQKCEAAIHLYEKNHFVHDPGIMARYGAIYARADVAMRYTRIPG